MFVVMLSGMLLTALTTLIHYEVLRSLHVVLPNLQFPVRTKLVGAILVAFVAHAVEISLYGVALFIMVRYGDVGSLGSPRGTELLDCFYFSAETYTSLGMGDIAPSGPLRFLAGVEALNGLLLIAWSASFIYLSMEKFWAPGPLDRR